MLRPEGDDLYAIEDVLERPDALDPAEGLELSDAVDEFRSRINRNRHDEAASRSSGCGPRWQVCDHSLTPADRRRIQRNLEPGGGGARSPLVLAVEPHQPPDRDPGRPVHERGGLLS